MDVLYAIAEVRMASDIPLKLRLMALESTAVYVQSQMQAGKVFETAEALWEFALSLAPERGLFLEFGVFKGDSINFFAERINNEIHGFDSFEGLPESWAAHGRQGEFSLNGKIPKVRSNVTLHSGLFRETLPNFVKEHSERVSFIHIDCDLYSSTKTAFQWLAGQIQSGTIIIFDEYFNYPSWEQHEFKAFQEFVAQGKVSYSYLGYLSRGTAVALRID